MIKKMKGSDSDTPASVMLGQPKVMLAARASLLEATKLVLSDVGVLETETYDARDSVVAKLEEKSRKTHQDLDEAHIENGFKELKPKDGSLPNSSLSEFHAYAVLEHRVERPFSKVGGARNP